MSCSRYDLYYGTGGVLSAFYYNCGDRTPTNLTVTGGVSGDYYGQIIASTDYDVAPLVCFTGFASAGGAPIPGYVYPQQLAPWIQYTYAVAPSGAQFRPLTAAEVPPTNP